MPKCSLGHYSAQTIILCVWQAIHLNVPPPGEPNYKQTLRKIRWCFIAMIAPEFVAFNAWHETTPSQVAVVS
jgi:hypothetical protein